MRQNPRFWTGGTTCHFAREQVVNLDVANFAGAYLPENLTPDALRGAFDSLVIKISGFEEEPRALYEIPEVRAFLAALHRQWPYAFFFCNLKAPNFETIILSRLTTLVVERRAGSGPAKLTYSRNELFQIIGQDFDPLEKACERAEFGPGVFQNRARAILKKFGFLKK
ncbi:MAG: hypothetical protein Q8N18_26365 [Opitutaceae bacterium]|nr:hypothetical protein [Opitutaceae bacterium]